METIYIYNTFFGLGFLLLFIAISYSYDIKAHPKSERITKICLILGDVFLAIGLFGRYQAGNNIYITGLILLISNFILWNKIQKGKIK